MWLAACSRSSSRKPVSRLTTPPGTSLVATISASSIATAGAGPSTIATQTLPESTMGRMADTRPTRGEVVGVKATTTPVASGTLKLKKGEATGFTPPSTWLNLSGQPAYQKVRSTATSTSALASFADIPASCTEIAAGSCSDGVTPGGKREPGGPAGARQGLNDYGSWFAGDADMGGDYYGYDGPAPPWNDERVHRYHFQLYATDLERCPVDGDFTTAEVLAAIAGHVLGEASLTGTYTLNPAVG